MKKIYIVQNLNSRGCKETLFFHAIQDAAWHAVWRILICKLQVFLTLRSFFFNHVLFLRLKIISYYANFETLSMHKQTNK